MELDKYMRNALDDAWPLAIFFLMYFIELPGKNKLVYPCSLIKLKLGENFCKCMARIGAGYKYSFNVMITEYGIICTFTTISIFVYMAFFSIAPAITRIAAHIAILIMAKDFLPPWNDIIELQFIVTAFLITTSCLGMYRAIRNNSTMEELGDIIIGGSNKRTSPLFFLAAAATLGIFHWNIILLRLLDFQYDRVHLAIIYGYFTVSQVYTLVYLTRCFFGLFFFNKYIPNFRRIRTIELIPITMLSLTAGILKPFNIVAAWIYNYLVFIGYTPARYHHVLMLENNRLKIYYAIIYNMSYFKASQESRKFLCNNDLKKNLNRLHFVESVLPLMIINIMLFLKYLGKIISIFRPVDIITIQTSFFLFVVEIFHSFSIVDLIKPYYNPCSGDLSKRYDLAQDVAAPSGDVALHPGSEEELKNEEVSKIK